VTYLAGSWDNLSGSLSPNTFDIILSSECIYREDLFESFTRMILNSISSGSVSLVAAKRYYFGCGGGTIGYCEYLSQNYPELQVELVHVVEDGMSNTREILSIRMA
jgi:hypothetical protein